MNRLLGSMRRVDEKRGAVRVEDVYDTDIADLWSAITEPHRLSNWIATVEGDLRVGGIIHARFTSLSGPVTQRGNDDNLRLVDAIDKNEV